MATKEQMLTWAKNKINTWTDVDGAYGAQCVDLAMAYTKTFGNYQMYGNAIDYMKNPLPAGWTRYKKGTAKIEPADLAIWHWGENDIYGHIGIVIAVYGNNITSIEQNVDGNAINIGGYARIRTRDDTHLVGFIRPCFSKNSTKRVSEYGSFTVAVDSLNVRDAPSLNSNIVATYSKNQKFNYDSYIINDGYIWLSYISYSGLRRYVASGEYNNNKRSSQWGIFH